MKGADAQVSYSEIRSPIDGAVTDRPLFAGETAAAGAPLLTIMDTSSLLAKAHIAQNLAQQMKLGDEAQINVPGNGGNNHRLDFTFRSPFLIRKGAEPI